MTIGLMGYENGLQRAAERERARRKTKREEAADMFNAARKLAREALEEENREAEQKRLVEQMAAEYGPMVR